MDDKLVPNNAEENQSNEDVPLSEDPLFKDIVYTGPAPADLAERHDDYLYGDEEN